MFTPTRRGLTALTAVATLAIGALAAAGTAEAAHPPGPTGSNLVLATGTSFSGYDVAADAAGTAYIGWIGDKSAGRQVHLCTLPVNATACSGGVQTIDSLGASSAAGLRVLATRTGQVTLVWFHDTTQSVNGPQGSQIAIATANQGLHLTAAQDVSTAPSFGSLLDAEYGPNGTIWTLVYPASLGQTIQVRKGLSAPTYSNLHTPWGVGFAQLAFAHSQPVITAEKYGAITTPPAYATAAGSGWTAFHSVANTWAVGTNAALVATSYGVRLVTGVGDASYRPAISKWTGSTFTHRALTADHNSCAPSTHDGYADGSGRFVDLSRECQQLTVASYPDAAHAALVRFTVHGTLTYAPQIASGSRGIATVAWTTQTGSTSATGSTLRVTRVRLPDITRTATGRANGGSVTVTGPVNCLPPVSVHVGVSAHHRHGWKLASRSLRLGRHLVTGGSIDGATLAGGKTFALHGKAIFKKGRKRSTATVTLSFRSCPNK